MASIEIKKANEEKIYQALDDVQKRCKSNVLTVKTVFEIAEDIKKEFKNHGINIKELDGVVCTYWSVYSKSVYGQKYPTKATHIEIEFNKGKCYLSNWYRSQVEASLHYNYNRRLVMPEEIKRKYIYSHMRNSGIEMSYEFLFEKNPSKI